jgi:hypothetical protein
MKKIINLKCALTLILFFIYAGCSSNSSYLNDPNASVVVTSQYEGSAEKIILPSTQNCSPPFNCADKKGANCAVALYHNALTYIEKANKLEKQEMYLSARVEYLMATCRLMRAQTMLNDAKLTNYTDWKIATVMGFEQKIQNKIKFCRRRGLYLDWSR